MPFEHHAAHRHHIPKPRYRVTNWPEDDAALRQRGSLTVWFRDEATAVRQDADPLDVLCWFVRRWSIEVTFAEVRRHLGVETQRQWSDLAIS